MVIRQPLYSKEEFARRGDEIYESTIRPQVEADNYGKIVAIDIETGTFAMADDTLAASQELLAKCPHAQTWVVRVGHRAVHRFGARSLK
ncbi:hypothetical protein Xen7305DRAFT_00042760 [Xenococcus sp. PCC 7305]|uniref:hypothetical protein n=1 Tax=Xenococcus sp. PCC 7305 TaxID=102125 RepID=UPI0002AC8C6D|nr:hypothetical protein [Xenococcus sp. PCC 7305]ELS04542.1 hypothetical protein Xen7305DRAFT_00042760 [Xenococcus sp. PCC 7305]